MTDAMLVLIAMDACSAAVSLARVANALRSIHEELKKLRQNQEAIR